VSYYADGGYAAIECCTMGTDVNAIRQTAYNMNIGTQSGNILYKGVYAVLSVGGTFARAYYADNVLSIEVGIATHKYCHRGIWAMTQTVGIVDIANGEYSYFVLLAPRYFSLGYCFFIGESFAKTTYHVFCRAFFIVKTLYLDKPVGTHSQL
jgi:hypothetical protein